MTLRRSVIAILGALFVVALVLQFAFGLIGWLYCGIYAAVLLALVGLELGRYQPAINRSSGNWVATQEKFEDPSTGKKIRVYFNPATGQRDYRQHCIQHPTS